MTAVRRMANGPNELTTSHHGVPLETMSTRTGSGGVVADGSMFPA
jgi:hypothetical protein